MYWILQSDSTHFIWDDQTETMYLVFEGAVKEKPYSLMMLSKFSPYLQLIRKTRKKPAVLLHIKTG